MNKILCAALLCSAFAKNFAVNITKTTLPNPKTRQSPMIQPLGLASNSTATLVNSGNAAYCGSAFFGTPL